MNPCLLDIYSEISGAQTHSIQYGLLELIIECIELLYATTSCICRIQSLITIGITRTSEYRISSVIRWSFFFQNNTKDLDPSCKMDLDLWDCLGRGKLVL